MTMEGIKLDPKALDAAIAAWKAPRTHDSVEGNTEAAVIAYLSTANIGFDRKTLRAAADVVLGHLAGMNPGLDTMLRSIAHEIQAISAIEPVEATAEPVGDLVALRRANIERQAIWCPDEVPDLSFRGNELGGEVGEALNVIKKLERERHGWRGSRDTRQHLAEELADVVICADLCAITAGIDLASAVVVKFNATSDKVGIPVHLTSPSGDKIDG